MGRIDKRVTTADQSRQFAVELDEIVRRSEVERFGVLGFARKTLERFEQDFAHENVFVVELEPLFLCQSELLGLVRVLQTGFFVQISCIDPVRLQMIIETKLRERKNVCEFCNRSCRN